MVALPPQRIWTGKSELSKVDAMNVLLKDGLIVLVPQSEDEALELAVWMAQHADHVLHCPAPDGDEVKSICLHDMGVRSDACREPINVVSNSSNPIARTISNLAETPFELDGFNYQSVESFWQGLKFTEAADRRRIAKLTGPQARDAGEAKGYGETVVYAGETIPVGTWRHWKLMETACRAKFAQHEGARTALLATGDRPLIHVVRRDSRAIPGVIMASIWTRIRNGLRERTP